MMAKKKEIPIVTLEDLGLKEEDIASCIEIVKMESPSPRQAGKVINDPPQEAARKLVEFLHKEVKVI